MAASTRMIGSFLIAAVLLGCAAFPARAASVSELQGAWVINSAECSAVFTKKGGRVAFRPGRADAETSFIISDNRIQGARASCTLVSEKRAADGLRAVLDCSSRMMVGALPISLRVPNPSVIVKFDPDFPEIETTFMRCE
ncbi:hypothetical protein [Microvirga rosea]|uniref:hypothetical protein n=1 Tax=Microvirga rosea TaxID=2715425 RepID=UPI001D0ABB47|nr:hypothetical protein [Microvirga rosea]MCB8821986.1 hypothetical protein [Microvirga rosea]